MTQRPHRGRNSLLFAVIVATALATSGCHVYKPYEPTPPTEAAQALEELKTLPSLEDTTAQVQATIDEITTAASKVIPTIVWETLGEGSSGNCQRRPYEQTGAEEYFLPHEVAVRVPVSEPDWTTILQAAKQSAAKIGATEMQAFQDEPGNHNVGFYGPTGIFIKIGYRGNLGVFGYTGCRLPRDKK